MDNSLRFLSAGRAAKVHAILVGDRIDTSTFVGVDVLSTVPLAYQAGANGLVVVFRYGVVVVIDLTPSEEEACLKRLQPRIKGLLANREDETATVEVSSEKEDQIPPADRSISRLRRSNACS